MMRIILLILLLCQVSYPTGAIAASANDPLQLPIQRGASFLKESLRSGRHYLSCVSSDGSKCPMHNTGHVFATFFIADAISDLLTDNERHIIINRITLENKEGLWGYEPSYPVDSDDTAYVLRTLSLLGLPAEIKPITTFYQKSLKAFTTFYSDSATATLTSTPKRLNNGQIHPEVNANIFTLLLRSPYERYINYDIIETSQEPLGYWRSYFYPGQFYSTYMSLRFLCAAGASPSSNARLRAKGLAFLSSSQNGDGSWGSPASAYDTALALNALSSCGVFNDDTIKKGLSYLFKSQLPNGSWESPRSVIWAYPHRDDPSVVWRAFDSNNVVTTSLVVRALRHYRQFTLTP